MKYHKITREEHRKILSSRHSVCPVPYPVIAEKLKIPERTVRRYANKLPDQARVKHHRASMFDPYKEEIEALLNKDMGKQSRKIKAALRDFRAAHPEMTVKKTAFYNFVRNRCDLTNEPRLARIPLEHDYGEGADRLLRAEILSARTTRGRASVHDDVCQKRRVVRADIPSGESAMFV